MSIRCINPKCGADLPDPLNFCPLCGKDQRAPSQRGKPVLCSQHYAFANAKFCAVCGTDLTLTPGAIRARKNKILFVVLGSVALLVCVTGLWYQYRVYAEAKKRDSMLLCTYYSDSRYDYEEKPCAHNSASRALVAFARTQAKLRLKAPSTAIFSHSDGVALETAELEEGGTWLVRGKVESQVPAGGRDTMPYIVRIKVKKDYLERVVTALDDDEINLVE